MVSQFSIQTKKIPDNQTQVNQTHVNPDTFMTYTSKKRPVRETLNKRTNKE